MTTDVATIISDQQEYAVELGNTVTGLVNQLLLLRDYVANIPTLNYAGHAFYDSVSAIAADLRGTAPVSTAPELPAVAPPSVPTISFGDVPEINIPEFNVSPPLIDIPARPTVTLPDPPGSQPPFISPPLPESPTYDLPIAPTLSVISVPDAPNIQLPSFYAAPPELTFSPPENSFAWAEIEYESALLDEVKAKLLSDLINGGYGIEPDDELQLVDRAIEREATQALQAEAEITRQYATRGFVLPPGALAEALQLARHTAQRQANSLNRDITLKRADLYVDNRKFALQQSTQVEQLLLGYHGAMMERLLNAAKYTSEAAIQFFNTQVETARIQLEQYKTEASVFEILLRAKHEELEIYRAQLDAARLRGDLDRLAVENYRALLQGVETLANIFRTRMEGARIAADIERLKLDAYRASIDAYVATIKGQEISLQVYEAAIRGEEAKSRVFDTQARAYAAVVDGKKAQNEVIMARVRTDIERANAQLSLYNAQNTQYKTQFDGEIDVQRLIMQGFDGDIRAFSARAQSLEAIGRLGIANFAGNSADFIAAISYNLKKAEFELAKFQDERKNRVDITKVSADFYANQAQAALSAINAIASQSA